MPAEVGDEFKDRLEELTKKPKKKKRKQGQQHG